MPPMFRLIAVYLILTAAFTAETGYQRDLYAAFDWLRDHVQTLSVTWRSITVQGDGQRQELHYRLLDNGVAKRMEAKGTIFVYDGTKSYRYETDTRELNVAPGDTRGGIFIGLPPVYGFMLPLYGGVPFDDPHGRHPALKWPMSLADCRDATFREAVARACGDLAIDPPLGQSRILTYLRESDTGDQVEDWWVFRFPVDGFDALFRDGWHKRYEVTSESQVLFALDYAFSVPEVAHLHLNGTLGGIAYPRRMVMQSLDPLPEDLDSRSMHIVSQEFIVDEVLINIPIADEEFVFDASLANLVSIAEEEPNTVEPAATTGAQAP